MNIFRALSSVLWGTLHQSRTLGEPGTAKPGAASLGRNLALRLASQYFRQDSADEKHSHGGW